MRYHARWVLPITQPPIENGTVVERDGSITYVGPRATAPAVDRDGSIPHVGPRAPAPAGPDHDLGDSILLPGLVNTHTHLELTVMRGFLEDFRFCLWGRKTRAKPHKRAAP